METPNLSKEEMVKLILQIGALLSLFFLSGFAFSDHTRNIIKQRAKYKSEISGDNDLELHCMHLDHTKGTRHYNSPRNGIYGTIIEHLAHHMLYRDNPEDIGLNYQENQYAINTLRINLIREYNRIGRDTALISEDLKKAEDRVYDYLMKLFEEA